MKLTLKAAKNILLLLQGEQLPYGQVKSTIVDLLLAEGFLQQKLQGRSRKTVFIGNNDAVENYLSAELGINNLLYYIQTLEKESTRAENAFASSNSKLSARRTFKGFLTNSYQAIEATMKGQAFTINPTAGTYTYIHDFEHFSIPSHVLVVGIENAENFRYIQQQEHLFGDKTILFVSRYPQSGDLINWLKSIPNQYLHFGDFDFEGIRIFRDDFYKHLGNRASFFIPGNIAEPIKKYGNKALYDIQYKPGIEETLGITDKLKTLLGLFNQYKKCLEQEILIEL